MGAFNLLDCSVKKYCRWKKQKQHSPTRFLDKAVDMCGFNDRLDNLIYTTTNCFQEEELWVFLFEGLKKKALGIDSEIKAREVYDSKGEAVLQEMDLAELEKSYMKDFDYGKALLCWHIATEICYNVEEDENDKNRKCSKILSDYLTYLLIHQPKLTAAVAGITHERYVETCLEVKESANKLGAENLKDFCVKALEVHDEENGEGGYNREHAEERNHDAETGGRGKSVLHDARNLARILINHVNKWEIIVRVWVEMLSYAAGHCRGNEHARTVSRGGELLTHVWLLMAHFGITAEWPKN
ncbi:hypothetical protein MLD38_022925 [Melastoma candidum]|uniref:Uncharacterized protein n=1 Tax=Melastoma candidum TaxID=119954 RepID=A0ACB9QK18_9MYRT|nr:hypothetical protein MLD38_022925 [Melastoma candidum]